MTRPQETEGQSKDTAEVTRDLASRIALAKRDRAVEANRASGGDARQMSGVARGMRIGTEFIAAILVGTGIGYLIDLGLGTSPWGLLTMFLVGFAAGILNVTRTVAQMNAASPPAPASETGTGTEGETDK